MWLSHIKREEKEIREIVKESDIDFIDDGEECDYIFKNQHKNNGNSLKVNTES